MGSFLSYSVAGLVSLALHLGLLAVLFVGWEPETTKVMIQPQYIKATLVELAPKKTVQPKAKPKVDVAKQKREAQKRKDKQRSDKLAAQKKAKDKKREQELKKELSEKKRLEALRLAEEQRLRDQQEAERKRLETEFAEAVAAEQADINAQEDERVANSYRQLIQQRLSENWSRPPSARLGMEATIRIYFVPTGRIIDVTLEASSGDSAYDRSVVQAALKVEQIVELQGMDASLFERKFRQIPVAFSPEDLRL
jgi:colicin import membrane protein